MFKVNNKNRRTILITSTSTYTSSNVTIETLETHVKHVLSTIKTPDNVNNV